MQSAAAFGCSWTRPKIIPMSSGVYSNLHTQLMYYTNQEWWELLNARYNNLGWPLLICNLNIIQLSSIFRLRPYLSELYKFCEEGKNWYWNSHEIDYCYYSQLINSEWLIVPHFWVWYGNCRIEGSQSQFVQHSSIPEPHGSVFKQILRKNGENMWENQETQYEIVFNYFRTFNGLPIGTMLLECAAKTTSLL